MRAGLRAAPARPPPGPRVTLRRARIADAPALARIRRASIRGLARDAYTPAQLAAWSRLGPAYDRWALGPGGEVAFLAERAGRAVGFAALTEGEVTAVFVRPAVARSGIGAALLARVEAEARRRGEAALFLDASLNAAPFYRAQGYRGAARVRVPLPDGAWLPALRLRKRL